MEAFHLLRDLAAVLAAALVGGFFSFWLRQPVIIGYLIGGLLIGPFGLHLISDLPTIEAFADLGVVLLMFALGVEFSLSELRAVKRIALGGGSLQIVVTVVIAVWIARGFGLAVGQGILLGCMVALSSTVIVLKMLMERGELDSAHGRALLGILVVQDLSVVLVMVLLPHLGDPTRILGWPLVLAITKAGAFLLAVVWLGTWLFPMLMRRVAATRNKELFLLAAISLCFGTAAVSYLMGLSLALGAFIAGVVVSESDHSHQVLADVVPLRDLFATLFFVSIGMLIDPTFLKGHLLAVAGLLAAILLGKSVLGLAVSRLFGYSGRTSLAIGLGLAQIGEFSFVLAKLGERNGLISADLFSLVLSGAILSLLATPVLMQASSPLYRFTYGLVRRKRPVEGPPDQSVGTKELPGLVDHVVICGYGRVGMNLGEVLIRHGMPLLVIDTDPGIIHGLRRRNVPCLYGDSANLEVLRHAGIPLARAMVVALPDPFSCQLTVENVRALNPSLDILARSHRSGDLAELYQRGADEVVQPEFEASIEVIRYVLTRLGVPTREIHRYAHQIRQERYRQFLEDHPDDRTDLLGDLGEVDFGWFDLRAATPLDGQSLGEADLRRRTGVGVLALRREGIVTPNPDAAEPLAAGDSLLLMGTQEQLAAVTKHCRLVPTQQGSMSSVTEA